jgi:protein-tyrosine phosphatase
MPCQTITLDHPSKLATKTVLFLCTANYYRSRFSEYLFNALAKELGLAWRATSRGLRASSHRNPGPISAFTVERLTALGVAFDGERFPIQVAEADFQDADLVVAVKEAEHRPMMRELFPTWENRIAYWNVDDLDCATALQALPSCESCVRTLVRRLLARQEAAGYRCGDDLELFRPASLIPLQAFANCSKVMPVTPFCVLVPPSDASLL